MREKVCVRESVREKEYVRELETECVCVTESPLSNRRALREYRDIYGENKVF